MPNDDESLIDRLHETFNFTERKELSVLEYLRQMSGDGNSVPLYELAALARHQSVPRNFPKFMVSIR